MTILDLLGVVHLQIVTAAILLTLTLLSFGTLATRKTLGKLSAALQKIEGGRGAEAFFGDRSAYAPLVETIATARHICFLGPSLINIFSHWAGYLHHEKLNKQGATIQVLLLDPDCPAADSAAKCMNETLENLRRDIARSLSHVEFMLQDVGVGSIEVRLMPSNPNYSMVLIDPDEPNGRIFVEFIGYYSRLHTRPHVELTRQRDGKWYEYFLQQYRRIWKDSQVRLESHQ